MSEFMKSSEFIRSTENYKKRVLEYIELNEYSDVSTHMVNILVSVMMTRDGGFNAGSFVGGSFVSAVVKNDLKNTIRYGSEETHKHLKLIINVCDNCYL